MLKKNVGSLDRVLRIVAGIVLLGAFFLLPEWGPRWILLIGVVPLVTGLMSSCPLYSIFGMSTCPLEKS